MVASLIQTIRETTREAANDDANFLKQFIYFFELNVPSELRGGYESYLFPLMLAPNSITMDEPFALEPTLTLDGGVYLEENGIVVRKIRIRGTTGFKPKPLPGGAPLLLELMSEKKSFDRVLPPFVIDAVSGQRHMQYLQDCVFRAYGDLKKDPTTAKDTHMKFHNPKDGEHFEVVPENFTLTRSASNPVLYEYNIELLAVDKASATKLYYSEDKGLLDSIKDTMRQVNNAIQSVQAGIRDLTNLVGEIKTTVAGIGTILNSAVGIVTAATDFINGVTSLIQLPRKIIETLIENCDQAFADLEDAANNLVGLGVNTEDPVTHTSPMPLSIKVYQAISSISKGGALLLLNPSVFETPLQEKFRVLKEQQSFGNVSSEDLVVAAAASGPTRLSDLDNVGSGLTPGDYNRSLINLTSSGAIVPNYTSLQEITVVKGDTLASLAAKYLGDARKWYEIVVTNNMRPPFVSDQAAADIEEQTDEEAFPGAFGVGKKLLVPTYKAPPQARPLLPVIGVPSDQPVDAQLLGTDLQLVNISTDNNMPRFDIALDTEGGSTDAKTVTGIANLTQALELRMLLERGTNILYKNVGVDPIVGLKFIPIDAELVRYRLLQSLSYDPRIVSVHSVNLLQNQYTADCVDVDISASVVGYSESTTIKATI